MACTSEMKHFEQDHEIPRGRREWQSAKVSVTTHCRCKPNATSLHWGGKNSFVSHGHR